MIVLACACHLNKSIRLDTHLVMVKDGEKLDFRRTVHTFTGRTAKSGKSELTQLEDRVFQTFPIGMTIGFDNWNFCCFFFR